MGSDIELKAFSSFVADGVLNIVSGKEFDFGSLHQDWAVSIITLHPGPFASVVIDMTKCGRVSSTFYAGLMQLHFAFNAIGESPLKLLNPDPRMMANLKILQLENYFVIEG